MRVLHDVVMVREIKQTESRGGIILAAKTVESAPSFVGEVKEIGNGEEVQKMGFKMGQKVLIYAGVKGKFPMMPNTDDIYLVPHEAIIGIMEAGD